MNNNTQHEQVGQATHIQRAARNNSKYLVQPNAIIAVITGTVLLPPQSLLQCQLIVKHIEQDQMTLTQPPGRC